MQEIDIEQLDNNLTEGENTKNQNSFGKFKSSESLLNAYNNLEKEFTKKCQHLKKVEGSFCDIESLNKANPKLSAYSEEILAELPNCGNNLNIAVANVLSGKIVEPSILINDEQFLKENVYNNEFITGKIIASYLDGLGSQKLPKTIKNHGQISLSPPYKPKSLEEAGKLCESILNNRRI